MGPTEAFAILTETLRRAVAERPEAREALRALAAWLNELLAESDRAASSASPPHDAAASPPPSPRGIAQLKLGDAQQTVPIWGLEGAAPSGPGGALAERAAHEERRAVAVARERAPEPDLPRLIQRCRLKAEACRWAVKRQQRLREDADFQTVIRPSDAALFDRARELGACYLWMLDPEQTPADERALEELAPCFDNLADALELAQSLLNSDTDADAFREEAYALLAEAQSAVRAGTNRAITGWVDQEQDAAFGWLRRRTFEDHVYVPRYMKVADAAEPAESLSLSERLGEIRRRIESSRAARRGRRELLNKARYHARKLGRDPAADEADADWRTLVRCVEELIEGGAKPSDRDIREILAPLADDIPETFVGGSVMTLVLREIDRYLASRESEAAPQPDRATAAPEVRQAAELLRGRHVALIGGDCRPHAKRAMERQLELAELRWLESRPHQTLADFEPDIARPECALVLLAIRWSSHSFGEVRSFCARYGKPLVRLPGGYNPTQVAAQILAQASDRLAPEQVA